MWWMFLFSAFLGAVANRLSGMPDKLPGRNIYYVSVILGFIAYALLGLGWAIAIFLSALCYRIPSWEKSIDMGTNEGTLTGDAEVMFYRGLFFVPVFLYAWAAHGVDIFVAMALLCVASAGALSSYLVGNYLLRGKVKDPFLWIELEAGAWYGAMVAILVAISKP